MDERKTLITQFCPQYNTEVEFFIETSPESGRTLIARYTTGGPEDLPFSISPARYVAGLGSAISRGTSNLAPTSAPWSKSPRVARAAGGIIGAELVLRERGDAENMGEHFHRHQSRTRRGLADAPRLRTGSPVGRCRSEIGVEGGIAAEARRVAARF
jgi:hypothetical protein